MDVFGNKEYKNLIVIFLVALILRTLLFIAVAPWEEQVEKNIILTFQDAPVFQQTSIFLAENKQIIGVFDKELYVYFIAFLYSIFGYKPFIVIIFQLIMSSLTCLFLYGIGRNVFDEKIALFAGLLLAFDHSSILYSNHLMSEAMFILLFTIHIYFLVKYLLEKNMSFLIYASIFLGISSHVRPIGLYFIVFLTLPLFLYFRGNFRKCIVSLLILLSVFFVTVSPWMVRNYVVAGEFTLSTDQGKALKWFCPNLLNIINPRPAAIRRWTEEEKRMMVEEAEQPGMNIAKVVRKYREEGVTAIRIARWQKRLHEGTLKDDRPPRVRNHNSGWFNTKVQSEEIPVNKRIINAVLADMKANIIGMSIFLGVLDSGAYPEILGQPVHIIEKGIWNKGLGELVNVTIQKKNKLEWFFISLTVSFLFYLYFTMCFGIYTAIKKKEFLKIVLFITVILYFAIISSGTTFHVTALARYRLPIIPYIILLSCYGMTELIYRFRKST